MKKIALAIVVISSILAPSFSKAVSYRGFVDGSFETSFSKNFEHNTRPWMVGASTTHGLQISKNFFVGVGIQFFYTSSFCYNINDQFHLTNEGSYLKPNLYIRWDGFGLFKKSSRVSPFIDFKIGYGLKIDNEYTHMDFYGEHDYDEFNLNGWFFRPTLGIRLGCSSKVGLNLGLFCDVSRLVKIKGGDLVKSKSAMWVPVGVSIGVDF